MFLEVYERIGKMEEKHSFEASISDSNAALNRMTEICVTGV